MSKGSFYYHYVDKEHLFVSLLAARMAEISRAVEAAGDAPDRDFWAWVRSLFAAFVAALAAQPDVVPLGRAFYGLRNSGAAPRVDALWADALAFTEEVLAAGQRCGAIRADLPLSLLAALTMGMGEAMDRWALSHDPELHSAEEAGLLVAVEDLFRRALAPGAG